MHTTLDITKDHCPMTFVKVKLGLSRLASGDILEVLLKGDEPLHNVPKAAVEQGHAVLEITPGNDHILVVIQKG
jgi:tRNA 2-thiouridine synthesizing protein A